MLAQVREHPRKPGRYRVRLADTRTFLVDAATVGSLPALREGVALDEREIVALEQAHAYTASLDRALAALGRARRSRRELARRLAQHEPDADLVARVLDRLEALGLLDDAAVARAEAASRFQRGEGAGRVRQALLRKGIERAAVEEAIREVTHEEAVDEVALCLAAAERRLRTLRNLAPEVQRRRLTGYLMRRGFGGAAVHDVVRRLLRDVGRHGDAHREHERLDD